MLAVIAVGSPYDICRPYLAEIAARNSMKFIDRTKFIEELSGFRRIAQIFKKIANDCVKSEIIRHRDQDLLILTSNHQDTISELAAIAESVGFQVKYKVLRADARRIVNHMRNSPQRIPNAELRRQAHAYNKDILKYSAEKYPRWRELREKSPKYNRRSSTA